MSSYAKPMVAPALDFIGYALLPVENRMLQRVKETETLNITLGQQVWRSRTRLLNFIVKFVMKLAANVLLMEHAKLCFFEDDLDSPVYRLQHGRGDVHLVEHLPASSVPPNADYNEYIRTFHTVKYAIGMRFEIIGIRLDSLTDLTFDGEPEEEVDDRKTLEDLLDTSLVCFMGLQSVLGQLNEGFHEVKRRRTLARMR
jgi:hypothetical protein